MGKTPARDNKSLWSGTNKWIAISDMGHDVDIRDTKEKITDFAVATSGIKPIPANTLVMSFKLSIGKVGITCELMYSNEAIMALIVKDGFDVDIHFMYHQLKNKDWSCGANRAVMGQTLNKRSLMNHQVILPPLAVQRKIAAELDRICALKRTAEKTVEKLGVLVKARFVEMFGDVVANDKQWPSMSFKEAGTRLSDGPFGSNLKSSHYSDVGVRVIRLGNIGVGKFLDADKSYIPDSHYEKLKKFTCHSGDIVIGTLGDPNLRACIIPDSIDIAINKSDCVHYVPRTEILLTQYVCAYINDAGTLNLASGMIHGQTRSRVSSGQIAQMPIRVPPLPLQREFAAFVAKVEKLEAAAKRAAERLDVLYRAKLQEYFA